MITEQEGSNINPDQAFVQRAKERIKRMNSVAGDVTKELDLPAEAKNTVLGVMFEGTNARQGEQEMVQQHPKVEQAVEQQQAAPKHEEKRAYRV